MSMGSVLAVQIGLLTIYLSSTFVRTLGRGFSVTNFEIAQCVVAFLITATGTVQTAHGHPAAILIVGIFCAACGAASYAVSFAFLGKDAERNRNFHVYTAFGLALVVTGTWLLTSALVVVAIWSALAIVFVRVGTHAGRTALSWHTCAYLVLATFASGSAAATNSQFLGADAHAGPWWPAPAAWLVTLAAGLSFFVVLRARRPPAPSWNSRLACVTLAACAGWNLAGIAAGLFAPLCLHAAAPAVKDYCPTAFTGILVLLVLGAALGSERWNRDELAWMAYFYLLVATYKLIAQDLPHGQTLGIVISLLLYGGTMILLPRISRKTRARGRAAAA
jgi:hypothetical protein